MDESMQRRSFQVGGMSEYLFGVMQQGMAAVPEDEEAVQYSLPRSIKVTLDDFEMIKVIGRGAFGKVFFWMEFCVSLQRCFWYARRTPATSTQ
jgi:hypothetical protein